LIHFIQLLHIGFKTTRKIKERMEDQFTLFSILMTILTVGVIGFTAKYELDLYHNIQSLNDVSLKQIWTISFYSILAMQLICFGFSIYKANYDSVIINPTIFAAVSTAIMYKSLNSILSPNECSIDSFLKINRLASLYLQSILSKFSSDPLSVEQSLISKCLNINFFIQIIMPIIILMTFKYSLSEWNLFWYGPESSGGDEKDGKNKANQQGGSPFYFNTALILFVLIETSCLLNYSHNSVIDLISIVIAFVVCILKLMVADYIGERPTGDQTLHKKVD